jgi:hypothetical protein
MPVTSDSLLSHSTGLFSTGLGSEMIFLNAAKGIYVGLDEIGRRIWELLATPSTVTELCARLALEFKGDSAEVMADVTAFLNELVDDGLIEVAERTRSA